MTASVNDGNAWQLRELNNLQFSLIEGGLIVGHRAGRIIRKAGEDVVRDAKAMCPVKTGNLRSSISIDFVRGDQVAYDGMAWEAGPTASYGHFVEFGTVRSAPHAYLGPAFDRMVPGVVAALGALGSTAIPLTTGG